MILDQCCPPNSNVPVNVPGSPGEDGDPGAPGQNAYTLTTADFTLPAVNATVTVSVANSGWMAVGQNVFASDGTNFANFTVNSIPNGLSAVLTYLGLPDDATTGTTISSGATVTPIGPPNPAAVPVSIANGGTNAITKAAAQTNLGLGQDPLVSNSTGLSQTITASYLEVGTCDVEVTDPGTYLLFASAVITMVGVTFAASRNITLKIRNVTQGTDIIVGTFPTGALTTTDLPALLLSTPVVIDSAANASDHYQLMITIDTINSAGTLSVTEGRLSAVPLRLN